MKKFNEMTPKLHPSSGCCERCKNPSTMTTMSKFNTEMICPTCDRFERGHSQYVRACQVEQQEVRTGNYNFEGIGLPDDFEYPN